MATAVRDIVDLSSARYARAWQRAQGQIVSLVDKLTKAGRSADDIVTILGNTDFTALVADAGMAKELQAVQNAYRQILSAKVGRHAVSESTLTALQAFTQESFLAQASAFPSAIKRETMKALIGGGRTSDVAAALNSLTTRANAATEAATALSTFSRSVGYEQAKLDPPDTRYEYEGPVDDVTRDICLEMAAAGPLTLEEIETQFPGAFVDGGGFNCRHEWVPADAAENVDAEAAQEAIAAREDEGRWETPQTVREALSGA